MNIDAPCSVEDVWSDLADPNLKGVVLAAYQDTQDSRWADEILAPSAVWRVAERYGASPRGTARLAALRLADNLLYLDYLKSPNRLSEELRFLRDRHSLTRRQHFYSFVDEVNRRFTQQNLARCSPGSEVVLFASEESDPAAAQRPRSFLSKLAAFLGLPFGAASREYHALKNRDLEWIWESVIEEVEAAATTAAADESIWQLLHDRFLRAISETLSSKRVTTAVPESRGSLRERLLSFGFWSGTPPPEDVEASPRSTWHRYRRRRSLRGHNEALCRSHRGGDPSDRLLGSPT